MKPVAVWKERDVLDGEVVDAFVAILRTKGCRWARTSGCSFCGYISDTNPDVGGGELKQQLGKVFDKYNGEPYVKIFTSGSFLDDDEVPPEVQEDMLSRFRDGGARRVTIETLPVYCTPEKVDWAVEMHPGLEIAIGLESADDRILEKVVNKSSRLGGFVDAAGVARSSGVPVKAYLVIKPPFLSESESLDDAVRSAGVAGKHADSISFNPITVQTGTVVDYLWRRRSYRPAWLWTVLEALKRSHGSAKRVMSFPTAAGSPRGAHNCGKCDKAVKDAIIEYSLSGDPSHLDVDACSCRNAWRDEIELGDLVYAEGAMDWPR